MLGQLEETDTEEAFARLVDDAETAFARENHSMGRQAAGRPLSGRRRTDPQRDGQRAARLQFVPHPWEGNVGQFAGAHRLQHRMRQRVGRPALLVADRLGRRERASRPNHHLS